MIQEPGNGWQGHRWLGWLYRGQPAQEEWHARPGRVTGTKIGGHRRPRRRAHVCILKKPSGYKTRPSLLLRLGREGHLWGLRPLAVFVLHWNVGFESSNPTPPQIVQNMQLRPEAGTRSPPQPARGGTSW